MFYIGVFLFGMHFYRPAAMQDRMGIAMEDGYIVLPTITTTER
jgi:hypothetical protein